MKKAFAIFGVALMAGLALMSCKKDDKTNYPASITSSVWSGGNASTGYNCDVTFGDQASMPGSNQCVITVSAPDKSETVGSFQGTYAYDAAKGTVTVQFAATSGGPSSATLQFNSAGDALAVSFTAPNVDYGTYTVFKVTYPQSIAGDWKYETNGMTVKVFLSPYAVNGGLPCTVSVWTGGTTSLDLTGTYTYDAKTGKGDFTVASASQADQPIKGTFMYNADGTLSCTAPSVSIDAKLVRGK